jgi:ABC-2 type transport system ATP-binding protein
VNVPVDILAIENVRMGYDGRQVIHDINLQVKPGEFFGLVGLNGAGKTTLIKAILGLRRQNTGTISVFGAEAGGKEGKSSLAYLPERFEPPWFLSGMEFLRFSLKLYHQKFDEAAVLKAAESLALDPAALKRRVQTYSKGMRQKLGLLGTVLTNCKLLVLDEPMSGLDPKARTLVKDMLVRDKQPGQTIFFCSHILADMDEICDRIAVLHEGSMRFIGKPADLKKNTGCENLERAFLHFIEEKVVL